MASDIYKTAFRRELEYFISVFSEDSNAFYKRDNKLIHTGEFGRFREEATKKILRMTLKPDVSLSDGFLINAQNEVSTQCDIIIHNANFEPIMHDNIVRMFPVEDVRAIFEIKSTMTKAKLKNALLKLAKNKQLRKITDNTYPNRNLFEYGNTQLGTFLICNNFDFNLTVESVNEIMKSTYEANDIPSEYWHNGILSIQDGIIIYTQPEIDFASDRDNHGIGSNLQALFNNLIGAQIPTSYCWVEKKINDCVPYIDAIIKKDKLEQIAGFFACVNTYIHNWCKVSSHDPMIYLGINFQISSQEAN